MQPIKIALGDLKHITAGKHSFIMPIGIGYIASYLLSQVAPKTVEIRLYYDPNLILNDIAAWKPDIIGLSNYCWNSELSRAVFRYAKKVNQSTVSISGGPDFPAEDVERKEYLSKRPEIDFYAYFEGEIPFALLVKKLQARIPARQLKSEPQNGIMSIHPETGGLVSGKLIPKIIDLDKVPSPYLNGLLDQWFDGYNAPMVQTARGCPFSCGFCFAGQPHFTRMANFGIQRVKDELTYIAERMNKYPKILLSICDSNFGMTKRDEEIAVHIRKLQDEFNWPNAFNVTTGKRNYDRILRISDILKNEMHIVCSLQSLNPKTLEVIKRKNLPLEEYRKINIEVKKRGMWSVTELIAPLPEETKSSFFEGVKSVINILEPERLTPYTTLCLKGTYLASKECRKKYRMQTKFRILPRQFGEYVGEKCFEIDEACIATSTMSFEDYLEIRGFSLVSAFFSNELFDVVHRHLKELNISTYDYFYHLWELIKSGETALSEAYARYIKETREELWDSREALYNYFSKKENYDKLLDGSMGDNLIRKYKTELFLEACVLSIELAYSSLEGLAGKAISDEIRESLVSAKRWMIVTRNISAIFKKESYTNHEKKLSLPYDVNAWYLCGSDNSSLVTYNRPADYRIFCDIDSIKTFSDRMKKLYGGNFYFQVSKLLMNWNIKNFCYKCEPLNK